jgi:hypothetical protein
MTRHEGAGETASAEDAGVPGSGLGLAAVGLLLFLVWQFIVNFFIVGSWGSEFDDCISVTEGAVVSFAGSPFPVQVWCETEANPFAGSLIPLWRSVAFSSVTVMAVLITLYGVWTAIRIEKDKGASSVKPTRLPMASHGR